MTIPDLPALVARYEAGEGFHVIARTLGISGDTLRRRFVAAGVKLRTRSEALKVREQPTERPWLKRDVPNLAEYIERYRAGESLYHIANTSGVGYDLLKRHFREQGVPMRSMSAAQKVSPHRKPRPAFPRETQIALAWSHVDKSGECWIWTGFRNVYGYGMVKRGGRETMAHRYLYEAHTGQAIPPGMYLCHTCDNPSCVRPDHLFVGTPRDNTHDMIRKDRHARGERQPRARLTERAVLDIRMLCATGVYAYRDIGEQFGIRDGDVFEIARGRKWKHVGGPILTGRKKRVA